MNVILMFGMPNGTEWLLILAVIVLLFGGSKLPQLAKALGQSKKAFKEGLDEAEEASQAEKANKASAASPSPGASAALSGIDDEALFEEARRRAQLRAAESVPKDNLLSANPAVEQKR